MLAVEAQMRWLKARSTRWVLLDGLLARGERAQGLSLRETTELNEELNALTEDAQLARMLAARTPLSQSLDALALRGHRLSAKPLARRLDALKRFFASEVPESLASIQGALWISAAVFVATSLLSFLLVRANPELAQLFASEKMISGVERGELWTEGILNVVPSSVLSLQIMTNNIMVCLVAYALGVFYGVGTFYILLNNGLMLGTISALCVVNGIGHKLLQFVLAHGVTELSIIVLAAACGLAVGDALAHPGERTRTAAFRDAFKRTSKVVLIGALFLVLCGIVEGYVSPNEQASMTLRAVASLSLFTLFVLCISGRAYPKSWRAVRGDV